MTTHSDDPALEWWMDLAKEETEAVETWLGNHPAPRGTSGIQYAWEHREEIEGVSS